MAKLGTSRIDATFVPVGFKFDLDAFGTLVLEWHL